MATATAADDVTTCGVSAPSAGYQLHLAADPALPVLRLHDETRGLRRGFDLLAAAVCATTNRRRAPPRGRTRGRHTRQHAADAVLCVPTGSFRIGLANRAFVAGFSPLQEQVRTGAAGADQRRRRLVVALLVSGTPQQVQFVACVTVLEQVAAAVSGLRFIRQAAICSSAWRWINCSVGACGLAASMRRCSSLKSLARALRSDPCRRPGRRRPNRGGCPCRPARKRMPCRYAARLRRCTIRSICAASGCWSSSGPEAANPVPARPAENPGKGLGQIHSHERVGHWPASRHREGRCCKEQTASDSNRPVDGIQVSLTHEAT